MPRKCPPGAICIENITLIFLIMIILLIIYLFNRVQNKDNIVVVPQQIETPRDNVFLNPHTIPSRNNIYDKKSDCVILWCREKNHERHGSKDNHGLLGEQIQEPGTARACLADLHEWIWSRRTT